MKIVPNVPKLNKNQLKQLADFASNLGLVFLASVIAPLFSGVDSVNLTRVILGLVLMLIAISVSILLLKGR